MALSPASSEGGGIAAPWTQGATGAVVGTVTNPNAVALTVKAEATQTADHVVEVLDKDDHVVVDVEARGVFVLSRRQDRGVFIIQDQAAGYTSNAVSIQGGSFTETCSITSDGQLVLSPVGAASTALYIGAPAAPTAPIVYIGDASLNEVFRISKNGYVVISKNAAPADAELSASQLAFWFDSTNGASKAMFKGKSADGTVVTAAVALA